MADNVTPIQFVLDPLLDFRKTVAPVPPRGAQRYDVRGYVGGGWDISTPQGRAANCHYAVNEAIEQGIHALGNQFNWSRTPSLAIVPESGRMWNAFYNRKSLQFFFNQDDVNQKPVFASSSAKIVFHEAGHAVLDAIRPDLYNMANFEVWASHEAFGDLHAFFCTMRNDEVLTAHNKRLWTGIGLEFGAGIYKVSDSQYRPLRDLAISFPWVPASTLPARAPDTELCAEPHSFSRVFSSATYMLFLKMLAQDTAKGEIQPARTAATALGRYLVIRASLAAVGPYYMSNLARAMMYVDWREGSRYLGLMDAVYTGQKILRPEISIQGVDRSLPKQKVSVVRLADHKITSLSNNPLHQLLVVVGHDDATGPEAALDDVAVSLDHIHRNGLTKGPGSPFVERKGKLLRRNFSCQFGGI